MLLSTYWYEYLVWYFIPHRLGLGLTAYLFSHLPHPEGVVWNETPFQATYNITGVRAILKAMWGQSNHALHHFLPHVPWYKYHKVWGLANGVFQKQNIPERAVFSRPDQNFKKTLEEIGAIDNGRKTLIAKVTAVIDAGNLIKSYVCEPLKGRELPSFNAGSHIQIHLPSKKIRSYSLVNPTHEQNRYQIAVKLEENGRGGSKEMHEEITVGSQLRISVPKNNFVLYEDVQKYILISGGIGITPLLSMAHKLTELEKHFEFHICAKTAAFIPFNFELQNWTFAPNTEIHLDKNGKSSIDLSKVLAKPDRDTLLYICGPSGFNKWIKETAQKNAWHSDQIKEEHFSSETSGLPESQAFEVTLSKSGKTLTVTKDQTIIDALLLNNLKVDYSCLQGTCGTCISTVLDGEIDHRDVVLTKEEKIASKKMCICVSRAKNDRIVLDL